MHDRQAEQYEQHNRWDGRLTDRFQTKPRCPHSHATDLAVFGVALGFEFNQALLESTTCTRLDWAARSCDCAHLTSGVDTDVREGEEHVVLLAVLRGQGTHRRNISCTGMP